MNWFRKLLLRWKYPNVKFFGDVSIKKDVKIGKGTGIGEYVVIGADANIGENCIILYHVTICKDAVIFDNVFVGPNTSFFNDKYPPSTISQPPVILEGAIIGGQVSLCPDIVIGRNSVVGAGSVITNSIPNGEVWIGNPARFLMTRQEYDKKKMRLNELVQKETND